MRKTAGWPLWLEWVAANSVGETLGLGGTFAVGFLVFSRFGEPQGTLAAIGMALLMTTSGLLEGAVVGIAQWLVIRRPFPGLAWRSWVGATILGALVAWGMGSIPMTLASVGAQGQQAAGPEPQASTMLLLAAGMGLFAGLVLGFPQWLVLRSVSRRAWLWLPANGAAWGLGMPMVFAAADLAQGGGTAAGAVATMAVAVAVTGAVVGAVHGGALVKLASQSMSSPGAA